MSGNIQPQSSQLAEPLWTDPGIKSGMSVRELISTLKKKKTKRRGLAGNGWLNILPESSQARKKPPPSAYTTVIVVVHRCTALCRHACDYSLHLVHPVGPRGLTFMWWGCSGFCFGPKATVTAHSFFFILFLCLFLSLWPFQLYFIPQILPSTECFLTLFFRSYFCLIGPFNYISLYESLPKP